MRANTLIGLMVILVLILGVTRVKYVVGDVKRDVKQMEALLAEEQAKMHVLQAEWAHLTRPERLAELNAQYLALVPVSGTAMQEIHVIPVRGTLTDAVDQSPKATEVSYGR
jgi:hypothetical protein